MRGKVLVRCGEGSEEADAIEAHGAFILLHPHAAPILECPARGHGGEGTMRLHSTRKEFTCLNQPRPTRKPRPHAPCTTSCSKPSAQSTARARFAPAAICRW